MLQLTVATNSITERVRGEFREMPGLTLTVAQAGRLWSLDAPPAARYCRSWLRRDFSAGKPMGRSAG